MLTPLPPCCPFASAAACAGWPAGGQDAWCVWRARQLAAMCMCACWPQAHAARGPQRDALAEKQCELSAARITQQPTPLPSPCRPPPPARTRAHSQGDSGGPLIATDAGGGVKQVGGVKAIWVVRVCVRTASAPRPLPSSFAVRLKPATPRIAPGRRLPVPPTRNHSMRPDRDCELRHRLRACRLPRSVRLPRGGGFVMPPRGRRPLRGARLNSAPPGGGRQAARPMPSPAMCASAAPPLVPPFQLHERPLLLPMDTTAAGPGAALRLPACQPGPGARPERHQQLRRRSGGAPASLCIPPGRCRGRARGRVGRARRRPGRGARRWSRRHRQRSPRACRGSSRRAAGERGGRPAVR
jgi:hypothetical protein